MSTFDYNECLEDVQESLTEFGNTGIIQSNAGTANDVNKPWLGNTSALGSTTDILAVRLPVTKREDIEYIQKTNISGNVYKFLTVNNTTMTNGDVITYDSKKYTVIKHKQIKPDDVTVLWDCLATEVTT